MFAAAVAKLTNSIFPIYRVDTAPNGITFRVTASGFFIDAQGTFVTVAHAFDRAGPNTLFQYRGRSPDNFQNPALPIQIVRQDDERDIVVGRVDLQLTHGLEVSEAQVPLGTSVCVAGYPLARLAALPNGGLDVGNVRRYFQSAMVLDGALCVDAQTRRQHVGFMMTEFSLFGMSGGPVVNGEGIVVGMQASVTQPRVSEGAGGRRITVENAVAIGSPLIHGLLARMMEEGQRDVNPPRAIA